MLRRLLRCDAKDLQHGFGCRPRLGEAGLDAAAHIGDLLVVIGWQRLEARDPGLGLARIVDHRRCGGIVGGVEEAVAIVEGNAVFVEARAFDQDIEAPGQQPLRQGIFFAERGGRNVRKLGAQLFVGRGASIFRRLADVGPARPIAGIGLGRERFISADDGTEPVALRLCRRRRQQSECQGERPWGTKQPSNGQQVHHDPSMFRRGCRPRGRTPRRRNWHLPFSYTVFYCHATLGGGGRQLWGRMGCHQKWL